MSAKTVKTPHGSVPTGAISDPAVRDALMKVNENVAKLLSAHNELVEAVKALEGART